MEVSPSRKRPRPVISCLRCREKKLKCDRATPCQNCSKVGCRAAECTYNPHPRSSESLPKAKRARLPTEGDEEVDQRTHSRMATGVIEDLQQRVVKLEELLAVRPHAGNFGPRRDAPVQSSWAQSDSTLSTPPFLGTLVVKGSRTRYHGQNNRITLLNQFPDAKAFINHCSEDSALVGLAKEVQFLRSRSLVPLASSPDTLLELESFPELQNIIAFLPPKAICDKLLEVYTTNCEKTFRIIHVPSFLRQYKSFWQDPSHQSTSTFAPLLTAALSIAVSFDPQPSTPEESSSWDYLKQDATKSLQAWVAKLPRKQRVDLGTLQTETLLLLSLQLRLIPPEELWKASGSLVRSGMVMGLHVNLSKTTNMTFYQAECRRRLWITIVELDLQASITSGMPVMTPELDFGPLTPSNLNDVDFDESTSEPPSPSPYEETDSLAQITLASSLAFRIRVMNTVQHTNARDNISERVEQARRLKKYISDVPSQLKPDHDTESACPAIVLTHVLLDIFLRRPLLCLLRPVITHTSIPHDHPKFHEIRGACLESSLAFLSYQDYFDPHFADPDVTITDAYWNIFHISCQHDILWAALSVCEHMRLSHISSAPSPVENITDTATSRRQIPSKASLTRLIENTLESFTRRVHHRGSNVKDLILLATVLQSVRARGPVPQRERSMLQGAKNTLIACRQHLLSIATTQNLSSDVEDLGQMIQPADTLNLQQNSDQRTSTAQSQISDSMQLPHEATAEFDNFISDIFSFDDGSFMWNM